jgi:tetratricopeptide (TPR) repeat protein
VLAGNRGVVVVLASAVLLAGFGTAPAWAGTVDRAFSDTNAEPTPAAALLELQAQTSICKVGSAAAAAKAGLKLPSEAKALSAATALLSKHSSRATIDALLSSSKLKHAGFATAGLAGLAKAQPGVSLVGFLAAHKHDPSDPLPLLDAAAMLSSMGEQPQALALLDAAARLPASDAPLGISVRALIDNASGVAMFRLGRFSQAEAEFEAASGVPALPQAKRNLAAALLCQGQAQAAVTPYLAGEYSDPVQTEAATSTTASNVTPSPDTALDLSKGVPGTLPALTIPQTAADGAASAAQLASDSDSANSESTQDLDQGDTDAAFLSGGSLTDTRDNSIVTLWTQWPTDEPDLDALYAKILADHAAMLALTTQLGQSDISALGACDFTGAAQQACLAQCDSTVEANHATWLPQATAYDTDERAWASALYMFSTGLASNVTNQSIITGLSLLANGFMLEYYGGELLDISALPQVEAGVASDGCNSSAGTDAGESGTGSTPPAAPCPAGLSAVKFALNLAFVSISVDCDSVTVGASDGEGLGPAGSLSFNYHTGALTAFIGAQAGFTVDANTKLAVTGGAYITWDYLGNVTDVGLQASGPSLSSDWGNISFETEDVGDLKVSLAPELLGQPSP